MSDIASLQQVKLPVPDLERQAVTNKLVRKIISNINNKSNNFLSFAEYMQEALYHPQLGYYHNQFPKIGPQGDFITAPEISNLFGKCLARYSMLALETFSTPAILEFGAGNGTLASQLLQTIRNNNQPLPKYYILELSATLKNKQYEIIQSTLQEDIRNVVWIDKLPKQFEGLIIANEVLDAMPSELFEIDTNNKYWQIGVSHINNKLTLKKYLINKQNPLHKTIDNIANTYIPTSARSYVSELCLWHARWLNSINRILKKGILLLIDYGFLSDTFYHPDRQQGTLMCHYRHYSHGNFLLYPGLQDITAHVDFGNIITIAENLGFNILSYTNQANFLIKCGLLDIFQQSNSNSYEINLLTSPAEMGELFKVLTLGKNLNVKLLDF